MQQPVKTTIASTEHGREEPGTSGHFSSDREEDGAGLGEFLEAFLKYKWLILAAIVLGFGVGYSNYFVAKPRYEAVALIQIEQRSSGYTGSVLESISQFQPIFSNYSDLSAESATMKSRSLLSKVVDELNLDILAIPTYYPVIGEAIARRYRSDAGVAKPWFGQDAYAWGGEQIAVDSFDVPDRWHGTSFRLVAEAEGGFRIYRGDDEILNGKVGERAAGSLDAEPISIFVSYLKARPGTGFTVARRIERNVVDGLQAGFSVKQDPPGSGILNARFSAGDPVLAAETLNAIIRAYQRQNLETKSEQAAKTLDYLERQLPTLKERLDAAEEAYNSFRLEQGSIDIQQETKNVLNGIVDIDTKLFGLSQQREELRQIYTEAHPRVQAMDRTVAQLTVKRAELEQKMGTLPTTQQIALSLSRDVDLNTRIYRDLINTIQQLRIAKAGTVGNVKIVDEALPPKSAFEPQKRKLLAGYTAGGLMLGLGLAFLLFKLRNVVETAEEIERSLGLPVYGTIAHCRQQKAFAKALDRLKGNQSRISRYLSRGVRPDTNDAMKPFVVALEYPDDQVVESFRSLRTSLHFLLLESKNNVLLITGSKESVGKSFVSLNLAAVLAQSKKKVLLIDADMRRGHLNRLLGISKDPGLSEYITGQTDLTDTIRSTQVDGLQFISTGERPPNPSELLMAKTFSALLADASKTYDYVIVDAPPALAVSDAGVIGMVAGATLLVARAGQHHISELELTVKRLTQSGANIRGFVLNDVQKHHGYYRYGYRYGYGYRYRYASNYTYRREA
jgi:tyrosine-protein kinase Etk/Wzc